MTGSELTARVTTRSGLALAGVALLAAWVGGAPALVGVLAGGAISFVNFRWLAWSATSASAAVGGQRLRAGRMVAVGLRFLAAFGALAAVLVTGWAHPLALMGGLAVLPCILIAQGFRAARDED